MQKQLYLTSKSKCNLIV